MPLYLEQRFPMGRYHATRWGQGAFGDPFGEWPPSPWRLLRALAFRWFQWSRETGETNRDRLDTLLKTLARQPPEFYLPALTWRGSPIKQYLPTKVAWTDASAKAAAYRKPETRLNEDHYRAVSPDSAIYWAWPNLESVDTELLDALLTRMLYFGRAESWTEIKRVDSLPQNPGFHCKLEMQRCSDTVPVLAPIAGREMGMDVLLVTSENPNVKNREIPPGTTWLYARIPKYLKMQNAPQKRPRYRDDLCFLQFAVGGRVLPPQERWVIVAERFRGMVLRERFRQVTGDDKPSYSILTPAQKDEVCLLSGKDDRGQPLEEHPHAFFALMPDESGQPTRMVVWRKTPFTNEEIDAFLVAVEREVCWDSSTPEWSLRMLPLPFDLDPPLAIADNAATIWVSLTPFVPPLARHRFRKNGRKRPGETPEKIASKLIKNQGLPLPYCIETLTDEGKWIDWDTAQAGDCRKSSWVLLHRSFRSRQKKTVRERNVAPGYHLRLCFKEYVTGPIALGESSHFGLGLFAPVMGEKET